MIRTTVALAALFLASLCAHDAHAACRAPDWNPPYDLLNKTWDDYEAGQSAHKRARKFNFAAKKPAYTETQAISDAAYAYKKFKQIKSRLPNLKQDWRRLRSDCRGSRRKDAKKNYKLVLDISAQIGTRMPQLSTQFASHAWNAASRDKGLSTLKRLKKLGHLDLNHIYSHRGIGLLSRTIEKNQTGNLRALLSWGANPNIYEKGPAKARLKKTRPIHRAIAKNNLRAVQLLMAYGANLHHPVSISGKRHTATDLAMKNVIVAQKGKQASALNQAFAIFIEVQSEGPKPRAYPLAKVEQLNQELKSFVAKKTKDRDIESMSKAELWQFIGKTLRRLAPLEKMSDSTIYRERYLTVVSSGCSIGVVKRIRKGKRGGSIYVRYRAFAFDFSKMKAPLMTVKPWGFSFQSASRSVSHVESVRPSDIQSVKDIERKARRYNNTKEASVFFSDFQKSRGDQLNEAFTRMYKLCN